MASRRSAQTCIPSSAARGLPSRHGASARHARTTPDPRRRSGWGLRHLQPPGGGLFCESSEVGDERWESAATPTSYLHSPTLAVITDLIPPRMLKSPTTSIERGLAALA